MCPVKLEKYYMFVVSTAVCVHVRLGVYSVLYWSSTSRISFSNNGGHESDIPAQEKAEEILRGHHGNSQHLTVTFKRPCKVAYSMDLFRSCIFVNPAVLHRSQSVETSQCIRGMPNTLLVFLWSLWCRGGISQNVVEVVTIMVNHCFCAL